MRNPGLLLWLVLVCTPLSAADLESEPQLDRRPAANAREAGPAREIRNPALEGLKARLPDLSATVDAATGATRTLSRQTQHLTGPASGDPLEVGLAFIRGHLSALGLEPGDLQFDVESRVYSRVTGTTHLYLRQLHEGIPVYQAQLHFSVDREGRLLGVTNSFLPGLSRGANAANTTPVLDLAEAVAVAAGDAGLAVKAEPILKEGPHGPQSATTLEAPEISAEPIAGELVWVPMRRGVARLAWRFVLHPPATRHAPEYTVDAHHGEVWTRFDQVAADAYLVQAQPQESPQSGPRSLVANPARPPASPWGWHDTNGVPGPEFTVTRGNNANAYTDLNADNVPDAGSSPDGGSSLNFSFKQETNQAFVTNAFYWVNLVHDVQYRYGFDEAAGNFQENNYGRGGAGGDAVAVEAVDGGCFNNAFFYFSPDGQPGRTELCPGPGGPAALDNTVVVHEYGHGISQRQVGGPGATFCLTGLQTPSEGLSDWWALAYTHQPGQSGDDLRVIAAYLSGNPGGFRALPYTTDQEANNWQYASIRTMSGPHPVGAVWAQAAWEVYWRLVNDWGFSPDLYDASGRAGNQRMMLYVNEAMKLAPCNPTFVNLRDAIVQAAMASHGGEDVCRIWSAFAPFGLGTDASDGGGSHSLNVRNGFAIPAACRNQPPRAEFSFSCTGRSCSFDASASTDDGGIVSYTWAFGDGTAGSGRQVAHAYGAFGAYDVTLTVRDAAGLSGTQTRRITLAPPVSPRLGAWWNPNRSGNGISLQATGTGDLVLVWFTYRPDGSPVWYLSGVGPQVGSSWSQPLFEYTWNGAAASGTMVGQVTLDFFDPSTAFFSWTLQGLPGGEPFVWLFGGTGRTGMWYPPQQSGWGLEVWESAGTTVVTAEIYDGGGRATWVQGVGASGPSVFMPMRLVDGAGLCPGCGGGGSGNPPSWPAGELTLGIAFEGATTGWLTTAITGLPGGATWVRPGIGIARLTPVP